MKQVFLPSSVQPCGLRISHAAAPGSSLVCSILLLLRYRTKCRQDPSQNGQCWSAGVSLGESQAGQEREGGNPEIFPFLLSGRAQEAAELCQRRGLFQLCPQRSGEQQGGGTGGPKVHSTGCWITDQGPAATGLHFSQSCCWSGFNRTLDLTLCVFWEDGETYLSFQWGN